MAVELSETKEKSKAYMKELKDQGRLPTRYAKVIKERYPHFTTARIHNVANGRNYHAEIMDAIIELACENDEEKRLKFLEYMLKK